MPPLDGSFTTQVGFLANRNTMDGGDVAIDDVIIRTGACFTPPLKGFMLVTLPSVFSSLLVFQACTISSIRSEFFPPECGNISDEIISGLDITVDEYALPDEACLCSLSPVGGSSHGIYIINEYRLKFSHGNNSYCNNLPLS